MIYFCNQYHRVYQITNQEMERNQEEELRALQDTLYFIGGKWRIPVINSICNGHRRFREIERSIPGITTRMLAKELKDMEMNKLVKRTFYDDTPVLIEYTPTEHCRTFGKIILEMINWGREYREIVIKEGSERREKE